MKKILLALFMISSSSVFAFSPPASVNADGVTIYINGLVSMSNTEGGACYPSSTYGIDGLLSIYPNSTATFSHDPSWNSQLAVLSCQISVFSTSSTPPPPTCTPTQELINGTCTEKCPSGQERLDGVCVNSCNQMMGEFRKSDGTCQDCTPYTNFSSRSFCACDSQGSTYTPQALVTTTQTNGNYTYEKTNVTCDNGLRIAIYTNPTNINPQDYNATLNQNGTITPVDPNSTTAPVTDTNATYTPPAQTNRDIVEAIKATNDVSNEIKGEVGKVATDVKAMNEHLSKQGMTFEQTLAAIKANGAENLKSNQLLGDLATGQTQFKNAFGQWVNQDQTNANAQLGATNGVKSSVDGTTNAVNNQGKNITDKLDEVIKAIKEDGNGTSPTDNNNTGKEIDLNATNAKLDTLHNDNNKTHSILEKMSGFFDSNSTVDTNRSGSAITISDMLPDGGWGWFTTNSIKPKFTISGQCYCETAEFVIAGKTFKFPSPELLNIIPFSTISNILMAFLYVLGLKSFLRN